MVEVDQIIDTVYFYQIKIRYKLFQQSRDVKIGIISAFILIIAIICLVFPSSSPKHQVGFLKKFSITTNNMFTEVNNIAAKTMTEKDGVSCRKVAGIIQRSPAFEFHGCQIAAGLRNFEDKIIIARHSLQKMYSKGSEVYKSFDDEVEAMINKLRQKKGDIKYFKERLNILIKKIKDFRKLVEQTQNSIQIAEEIRHDTEGYIHDGVREAESFINSELDYLGHTIDIDAAKKELEFVNNLLINLNDAASHLDKMRKILMNYEDSLLNFCSDLDDFGKDDIILEATKKDFEILRSAVNILKGNHHKFIEKALISC